MTKLKEYTYIFLLILFFNKISNIQAQIIATEGWETFGVPTFGSGLPFGTISGVGSTGTNVGTTLTFVDVNTFTFPTITPKTGTWALRINTQTASSGNSNLYVSPSLNFQEVCANSQMTFSFWMYRTGTDANADRVRVLVNTTSTLGGATLLTIINRSRALSPAVYGIDGWYKYEVVIPPSFSGPTNYLMIDAIDGSLGGFGNIYIDDMQFYHSNNAPANINGAIANAGEDVTLCSGGQTKIGSISIPNTTYSWAPATGLSSSTVSNPLITLTAGGVTNYTVTATAAGCGAKTDVVTVSVSAALAPAMSSVTSTNVCSGNTQSFPFAATNSPTGYLWLAADNVSTSGESNNTTVNSGTLNDVITATSAQVVTYSVSAYSASCPAGTNPVQAFSVNVNVSPSGTAPTNIIVCSGGTAVFSTAASGGGPYTYQWQQNSVNIAGATLASLSLAGVTPAMNGNTYRCIISNGCTPSSTTTAAVLTVISPPSGTPPTNTTVCSGATAVFSTIASGGGSYTYQWQQNGVNIGGATLASLSLAGVTPAMNGNTYRCIISNFCAPDYTTTAALLTVNSSPTGTSPSNVTVCPGATAVFSTVASGGGTYTYQWQQNSVNIAGATSSSYSVFGVTTAMNGDTYRCIISNGCTPSYTTNAAVLTVATPPSLTLTGTNPACNGGLGTISASGTGISTYSWSTGQTTAVINVPAGSYNCTVTSAIGCTTSSSYVLTQPTVLSSFASSATICSGVTVNIPISAAGGTPPYIYNWIATSNPAVNGESTTSQTGSTINNTLINTSAATQNVSYTYSVTDANGCVSTGNTIVTVMNPVITTSAPSNTTICEGSSTSFMTSAAGGSGGFSYQWQVNNGGGFANVNNGGVYSGATTSVLNISAALISMNTYSYKCVVNDFCGQTVQSATAILTVSPSIMYNSSIAEQLNWDSVSKCSSKQDILRLKINISTGTCPSSITLSQLRFTMNGTSVPLTCVNKINVYYTGNNTTISTTTVFASNLSPVSGTISASGSQLLTAGDNYFWIAYDLNPNGSGTIIDATIVDFALSGGANPGIYSSTPTSPAGARSISTCVAPGGVSSGLTYWLKSNDGLNINGNTHDAPVNIWSSSYSKISDLSQPVAAKRPLFKDYTNDTTFNFNPYLSFDGTNDILQNIAITDLLSDDGLAMIICARSTTVAPNNRSSFGFQVSPTGISYQIAPENRLRYQNSAGSASSFNIAGFTDPDTDFIMAKMLSIAGNSSGTPGIADFMRNDDVFQGSGTFAPVVETGFTIGGSGDGAAYNQGNSKIAEVITYNQYLSAANLDKVETYAAIKYGIHLNKNYFSSAGTKIWDFSADPGYNNDIAGIGRDDKSGLNQKQTQSVNIDEMLTIGLDSIEDKNINNIAVFEQDNSFLVWGNNNEKPYSDYSTLIPAAAPFLPVGIEGRIKRVWKLQGTNFGSSGTFKGTPENNQQNGTNAIATVEVAFDDYLLVNVSPVANLRLLIDDDGVDFSNAIVKGPGKVKSGATASGARVVFSGVDLGGGRNYITLATTNKSLTPLPIELVNFNGVCENNLVSITWNTASENNVKDFTIEQSIDGVNFTVAKTLTAKGSSNTNTNYNTVCDLVPAKINYFRLKETTNNNDIYYYSVISIPGDCNNSAVNSGARISPNPVSREIGELTVKFNKEINGSSDIKVINSLGNTILENEFKSNENYTSLKLQIRDFKAGIYFLEIKNKRGNNRFKFIVVD